MFYTALVGFSKSDQDEVQYSHLPTDNCIDYYSCLSYGMYKDWKGRVVKVIFKDNFVFSLTKFICQFEDKNLLKHMNFVDFSFGKDYNRVYTILNIYQRTLKLDEEIIVNSGFVNTRHLLYLIESEGHF